MIAVHTDDHICRHCVQIQRKLYAESSDAIPQLSAAALDLFEYTLTFNLHWH